LQKLEYVANKKITQFLRLYRRVHKVLGLTLAVLLIISAVTGIFLAWKKKVAAIQPPTLRGQAKELADWRPLAELADVATVAFHKAHPNHIDTGIDRMDVRPSKGIVKVLFEKGWWEVQVDGATAEVLSIKRRNSDWIEQLHDGSIISDGFKLVSMNILGIGLLLMIFTGWYLWYGPRKYRRLKRDRKN
jgi:uncharacterized iron-regulated membrane protein